MFRNTFQSGFLSILYSIGSKPLQIWDSKVKNGHIKRITDQDIQSSVLEIMGTNVSTSYIVCPADPKQTLGIKLPFLVMIIKNLKKYFTFEVQVLDDKGVKRRFRASNYQSTTRVKPFICTMPMRLDEGWNQIQFNLSDFTRRAYGTNYVETLRVQIHANCRIRRIYFSDRLYSEEELPPEFKLFIPSAAPPSTSSSTRRGGEGRNVDTAADNVVNTLETDVNAEVDGGDSEEPSTEQIYVEEILETETGESPIVESDALPVADGGGEELSGDHEQNIDIATETSTVPAVAVSS